MSRPKPPLRQAASAAGLCNSATGADSKSVLPVKSEAKVPRPVEC